MRDARRLGLTAAIVLSAILFAIASPSAAAKPPVRETGTVVFSNEVFASCDGFDLISTGVIDFRFTVFFDKSGDPVRLQEKDHLRATMTNSVTGAFFEDNGDWTLVIDLTKETITRHGVDVRWVMPGGGIVVLNAGTVTIDFGGNILFVGGPLAVTLTDRSAMCAALD